MTLRRILPALMLMSAAALSAQTSYEAFKGIRLEAGDNQQAISLYAPASTVPYTLVLPQQLTPGTWMLSVDGSTGITSFAAAPSLLGTAGQVPFFTGASSLRGSASFVFDSTAKRLSITATSTTSPGLRLLRDGAVTSADTVLALRSTSTGGPYRRGLSIELSGSADTSVAIDASAIGATVNYAALLSGRVGVQTRTPRTDLDVNGAVAYRQRTHTVTSVGPHHNVDFGTSNNRSYVHVTGTITAASTWTGFAGGTDGKVLCITNATAENMVIPSNATSSTAGNRVLTTDGNDFVITPGATATFVYSQADLAWRVTSVSPLSISAFSNYTTSSVTANMTLPSSTAAYIRLLPTGNVGSVYLEDGAVIGQILVVQNDAAGNGNKFTLAGTNLNVGSTSGTLSGGEAVFMIWDGDQWQVIARKGT
ncbi:MAG: hypothetical protein FGM24_02610 [Candidatus Kapabacteria bacterium]|nr:hypothetical protein [Candidatus Kapabacteria bacterium]